MSENASERIARLFSEVLQREVFEDEIYDLVSEFADVALSIDWDSGGSGAGAGTDRVYVLGGQYFIASADYGCIGPFERLDQAWGTLHLNGATREIWCLEWSDDEVLDRVEIFGEFDGVTINGDWWPFERLEHEVARRRRATGRQ